MFLVGTFPLTIDSKSRLAIPFVIRDKMISDVDGRMLYVLPGRQRGTLLLYPHQYYQRMRQSLPLELLSESAYRWLQFECSLATLVEPDSQGRVVLPERLVKGAGIGREVTLAGAQDHLEVWDRSAYETFEQDAWSDYEQKRSEAMRELVEAGAFASPAVTMTQAAASEAAN